MTRPNYKDRSRRRLFAKKKKKRGVLNTLALPGYLVLFMITGPSESADVDHAAIGLGTGRLFCPADRLDGIAHIPLPATNRPG